MSRYKGKKCLVVGFGKSGVAATKYLVKQGARVMVTDAKQRTELAESIEAVSDLKVEFEFGKHVSKTFQNAELIVVSPGVPLNIKPLEEAREKGIPITNEVELAARVLKEPLISVTGTNGKTTVTTLIGEMFQADKRNAYLGGNIGEPMLNYVVDRKPAEIVVAELSSFQLELIQELVPAVAVFTNIDQDHLDRYPDMMSYVNVKRKLLKACDRNSYVVMNYDDPNLAAFGAECPGRLLWFTKRNPMEMSPEFAEQFTGVYLDQDKNELVAKITGKDERYSLKKLKLFGEHNKENLMAALCAARIMGASPQAVQYVIDNFQGVPHRLEFLRKKDGVYFFNDSKATNVMSVYRSLSAFRKSPVILLAGGRDKEQDFSPLSDLIRRKCKMLVLMGEAKEKINRAVGDHADTFLVGTFEEAVLLAFQKSQIGDVILMSPGCSSLDMFRNYEERGDYFKKLIFQL